MARRAATEAFRASEDLVNLILRSRGLAALRRLTTSSVYGDGLISGGLTEMELFVGSSR
jgi:hypothetical protein